MSTAIKIVPNAAPKLKRPKMACDVELHPKLRPYPMLDSFFNVSNTSLFLGPQGSGKTTLAMSLISGPLRHVYDKVYFWMPQSSRNSLRCDVFDNIDPGQMFEELTPQSLQETYKFISKDVMIERDDDEGGPRQYLCVFDDIQSSLRDKDALKMFTTMVSNQRHLHTTIWVLAQNFKKIDPKIRNLIHNVFLFRMSKPETRMVFDEMVELPEDTYHEIAAMAFDQPGHNWLMLNRRTQRIFNKDMHELVYKDSYPDPPPRTRREKEEDDK